MKQSLIYAGRPERLFAYLLDMIILLMMLMVVIAVFGNNHFTAVPVFLTQLAYYTYFTASRWQATPTQRLLKIYIVRTDYRILTLRDALERSLAFMLPNVPLYSEHLSRETAQLMFLWLHLFWFVPILYTAERTGVHDRLCNTRVLVGRVGA